MDTQQIATLAGSCIGGAIVSGAFAWGYFRRLAATGAAKAADSQALRELHEYERKTAEFHRIVDERLRILEIETGRQKGVLEQIDERLGEILELARGGKWAKV